MPNATPPSRSDLTGGSGVEARDVDKANSENQVGIGRDDAAGARGTGSPIAAGMRRR